MTPRRNFFPQLGNCSVNNKSRRRDCLRLFALFKPFQGCNFIAVHTNFRVLNDLYVVAFYRNRGSVGTFVELNFKHAREDICVLDNAAPLGGFNKCTRFGSDFQQFLVAILLVFQAAHKATAGSRNFGRIE